MDYASLKSSISDWIARSDLSTQVVDDIIDMAEARINRGLRVRAMETVYFRTLDLDGRVPVPTGYREFQSVYLYRGTNTDDTLPSLSNEIVSGMTMASINDMLTDFKASSTSGGRLARAGSYFYVGGKPEGTYGVGGVFYKSFDPLTELAQTNWLTTDAPDLLLAACMEQANIYVKAWPDAEQWERRTLKMIDDINLEDRRERMSGAKLVTRSGVRAA